MRVLTILCMLAAIASITAPFANDARADIVVVVNSANDVQGSDAEKQTLVRRILLKEVNTWPDGTDVKAFVPKSSSALGSAINEKIYMLSEAEFEAHWARVKQTTGQVRPREVGSTRILLKLIQRDPGAIGIVEGKPEEFSGGDLRVLFSVPE